MGTNITRILVNANAVDAYRPLLVNLESFDAGANIKGRRYRLGEVRDYWVADRDNVGMLPEHYWQQLVADSPQVDYIVWSYGTPVAWHVADPEADMANGYGGFWEVPDVRYSVTTSKHQDKIRAAIAYANPWGGSPMDTRPAGPFVNLMTGRAHQGYAPGWQSGGTPEERGVATLRETPAPRPEPEPEPEWRRYDGRERPEWTPELRLKVQRSRVSGKLYRRMEKIDATYLMDSPEWHYARSDHQVIRLQLDYIALSERLRVHAYEH